MSRLGIIIRTELKRLATELHAASDAVDYDHPGHPGQAVDAMRSALVAAEQTLVFLAESTPEQEARRCCARQLGHGDMCLHGQITERKTRAFIRDRLDRLRAELAKKQGR